MEYRNDLTPSQSFRAHRRALVAARTTGSREARLCQFLRISSRRLIIGRNRPIAVAGRFNLSADFSH